MPELSSGRATAEQPCVGPSASGSDDPGCAERQPEGSHRAQLFEHTLAFAVIFMDFRSLGVSGIDGFHRTVLLDQLAAGVLSITGMNRLWRRLLRISLVSASDGLNSFPRSRHPGRFDAWSCGSISGKEEPMDDPSDRGAPHVLRRTFPADRGGGVALAARSAGMIWCWMLRQDPGV